jgi:uncharacterized protein involved in exopolysaccharide biosynthesis
MLQRHISQGVEASPFEEQAPAGNVGRFLEPSYYLDVLKRRAAAFAVPFMMVLALGSLVVLMRPAIYLVEGKILVESPQIPSELVRSTVTAFASERMQLIEQRIMTRDNLLAVASKFNVFGRGQESPSIVALMRLRTQITPSEVRHSTRPNERQATVFTVSFEHEQPAVALRVVNELITTILNEDLRTRTAYASETTRFLLRETTKIERELSAIEEQIADIKRRRADRAPQAMQPGESQLWALKAELTQKTSIYSDVHPDIQSLKQKIAALERTIVPAKASEPDPGNIEALERQQSSLQKILEAANQKLAAAKLGESLERGQQSERLEVIEQPTLPNAPVRPNRQKLLLTVFALALAAGAALVFFLELRDDTIRHMSDLLHIAEPQLVGIPFIETKADVRRRKRKAAALGGLAVSCVLAAGTAAWLLLPVDKLLAAAFTAFKPI